MRVLIADDDHRVRQLLKSCLGDLDAQFIECANGFEAVIAASAQRPDWILMDLQMPGLDGMTATHRILHDFPEAQVVIVTQFEGSQLRQAAREAGARGYFLKDDLLAVRDFVLAQRAGEPRPLEDPHPL